MPHPDEGNEEGITSPQADGHTPPTATPRRRRTFTVKTPIRVSSKFLALRAGIEHEAMEMERATLRTKRDDAYTRLNLCRQQLTEYVASLEAQLGIERDGLVKF